MYVCLIVRHVLFACGCMGAWLHRCLNVDVGVGVDVGLGVNVDVDVDVGVRVDVGGWVHERSLSDNFIRFS